MCAASWIYPTAPGEQPQRPKQLVASPTQLKIGQVFSRHEWPAEEFEEFPPNKEANASLNNDELSPDNRAISLQPEMIPMQPNSIPYMPSKESASSIADNPLPFKISSVASGDDVALMTNGIPVNDATKSADKEQTPERDQTETENGELMIQVKLEAIDISDDEQMAEATFFTIPMEEPTRPVSRHSTQLKGYIYCSTNVHLGKVNIEWTMPNAIRLHLNEPIDIQCNEADNWTKNISEVTTFMDAYIRNRFYAVYPANLKLEWIFVKATTDDTFNTLCDFNSVEPFSVCCLHCSRYSSLNCHYPFFTY